MRSCSMRSAGSSASLGTISGCPILFRGAPRFRWPGFLGTQISRGITLRTWQDGWVEASWWSVVLR
ncbi:hypothetical protein QJS10_CPB13g01096 [Acorus calamus]|uniref:Uncharacterized protein n=1 Tax=Acorus calamus TaxID=4465 RepID=A0AAV9DH95_ACOCL|nr:hypothetical protein QJS10_CPB13g01096 [Acorus calamus]